ncbi:probable MOSC domain-containing protein 2, mitochondrial precursor [Rhynchosporium secalis]|uniref:Probable MOSC domain-containing protein 2, mitochondrial n=1 Tax=Rhynchosporium secalis TaxID=38038 RepID=A0A1E1MSU8_RHYSE|nr:probable MOSC domain-containing protein 2, mitochondrial precursor [Rhynchosporium secalis]
MLDILNLFSSPSATSEITELRIYPIKSCRGISIQKSFLTKQGLDLDRRWMFVDAETMKFITIRDISQMTLIDTSLDSTSSNLTISIHSTPHSVTIPTRPSASWLESNTTLSRVSIWDHDTDGYVYSDAINSIFTGSFSKPVKLVYKGPTPRILRGNGAPELLGREESTNFPDVMPVLIANESSLRELNGRLREKGHEEITVERFRPNIIVKGAEEGDTASKGGLPTAWSEDRWKTVRILPSAEQKSGLASLLGAGGGERPLEIDVQARCARCQVPNVDPDTAEKDKKEPWDTLVSYRRVDEGVKWKPCFGMLSCPRSEGDIAVGMKFEVVATTEDHNYIKGF